MRRRLFSRKISRNPGEQKLSYSIILLAFLELALLVVFIVQSILEGDSILKAYRLPVLIVLSFLIVFDVVSAVYTTFAFRVRRKQLSDIKESLDMVEQLNNTLRSQRHDFLNHLQVVYGLIEMEAYEEASSYIKRIAQDVRDVSRFLRTDSPAVNALLQAKYTMCKERGIAFDMDVTASVAAAPLEDWELCRILSNLIDNAVEAMLSSGEEAHLLRLTMHEKDGSIVFRVENNGPGIPEDIAATVFQPGISTKGTGRGTGLSIVRRVLDSCGGSIRYLREADWTVFEGTIPLGGSDSKTDS